MEGGGREEEEGAGEGFEGEGGRGATMDMMASPMDGERLAPLDDDEEEEAEAGGGGGGGGRGG